MRAVRWAARARAIWSCAQLRRIGWRFREASAARFVLAGPLKVALMLRLTIEYGLGGGSNRQGGFGVVDIVIVAVGDASMLWGEGSARHASSGDASYLLDSTCL